MIATIRHNRTHEERGEGSKGRNAWAEPGDAKVRHVCREKKYGITLLEVLPFCWVSPSPLLHLFVLQDR